MKIREIYDSKIAKFFGYSITIYPFILFDGVPDLSLKIHEYTHIFQVKKHGWLKFYISYLWFYIKGRLKGLDHYDSYMAISYEVEAYKNQDDFDRWYHSMNDAILVSLDFNTLIKIWSERA